MATLLMATLQTIGTAHLHRYEFILLAHCFEPSGLPDVPTYICVLVRNGEAILMMLACSWVSIIHRIYQPLQNAAAPLVLFTPSGALWMDLQCGLVYHPVFLITDNQAISLWESGGVRPWRDLSEQTSELLSYSIFPDLSSGFDIKRTPARRSSNWTSQVLSLDFW